MLRTKVVCTLGPATATPEAVLGLVERGMDLARINMSHGSREQHRASVAHVREAALAVDRPIGIMVDLSGPKIRVGELEANMELVEGTEVVLAPQDGAVPGEIPTTYAPLAHEIEPGDQVLLDDGLMELRCTGTEGDRTHLEVIRGGTLKPRKGINLPLVNVQAPSLTEKDLSDLEWALEEGVEYIALSFVRRASDVVDLKARVGDKALVVAKIEKVQAVRAIQEILVETDAVMVARGDLGVELPFERVPLAQKRIIQLANYYARPVITATQMLESMIENARPTRAEASDVANAILDGSDGIMLSGETAVGAYPHEAVSAMENIGKEIERSGFLDRGPRYLAPPGLSSRGGASHREHAVASATVDASKAIGAPAIIVLTRSGFTARLMSSYRPSVPVFAITTQPRTYRQLSAVWGVRSVLLPQDEAASYESQVNFAKRVVVESGVGEPGAAVAITAGFPFHESGTTNMMRLERL